MLRRSAGARRPQALYLLGGIDPDTGRGLVAYRFYLDEESTSIRVPTQLLTTLHYWIGPL
ncbi:hypothetical protein [Prescottella equi]|uniref:hypothetical protein n=1 Tax=Rhodococcus hoagii TaxID=43767 RepID=UPI0007CD923F|nr:hypothetical protein [Prescottella equi]